MLEKKKKKQSKKNKQKNKPPILTAVFMHYFRETVQSTKATPTQPTTLQHPGTMGNAAAVAVKDKRDIWYATRSNQPEQLSDFDLFFTFAVHRVHSTGQ